MTLVPRDCPKCGATLPPSPQPVVVCRYCGTQLALEPEDGGVTTAIRSSDTRAPVTITFVNHRATPIDLVWLDFDGAESSYGRADPGNERRFDTYVGHVWSLRDATSGAELLRWAARDQVPRHVHVR